MSILPYEAKCEITMLQTATKDSCKGRQTFSPTERLNKWQKWQYSYIILTDTVARRNMFTTTASSANPRAKRLTNCRQRARGYALWKPGATGKESFGANNLFTAYTLNKYPYRVCVRVTDSLCVSLVRVDAKINRIVTSSFSRIIDMWTTRTIGRIAHKRQNKIASLFFCTAFVLFAVFKK